MRNHAPLRSVYLPAVRDDMAEMLKLFDGADSNLVTGHRERTNAAQSSPAQHPCRKMAGKRWVR